MGNFTRRRTDFNPRFPRGKRLIVHRRRDKGHLNFNPRFPRGKRLLRHDYRLFLFAISIHASREGSDLAAGTNAAEYWPFQSTLPAREATGDCSSTSIRSSFQSTLPAREATAKPMRHIQSVRNFNPRFPRGKRHHQDNLLQHHYHISIHASREGSDTEKPKQSSKYSNFNPRFPRGKRPMDIDKINQTVNFNPRFPRGKRPLGTLKAP